MIFKEMEIDGDKEAATENVTIYHELWSRQRNKAEKKTHQNIFKKMV